MSPLESEELRMLADIGTIAALRGQTRRARTIFTALRHCRPAFACPYVGLALAYIMRSRWDDAIRTLDTGLAAVTSDHEHLHAMRAVALRGAGRASESDRAMAAAKGHPMVAALASLLPIG